MSGAPSGAAIAGLGLTEMGRVFGQSQRQLAASAVRKAVSDAGLSLADIDGLLICPGITGGLDLGLAVTLGLHDLSLLSMINSYGASAVMATQTAALAVTSGAARAVACVFADTPLREGMPAGSAFGRADGGTSAGRPQERHGLGGLAAGYGFRSVNVHYALAARRHMERYGTTSEHFGAVAVAQRQWAAGNPLAQYRKPITLADHQQSRWVAEPLHLLDCSLVSNGAVAIVVTSPDVAAAGPRPPVHVWGWGQGHPGYRMATGSDFGLVTGAVRSGQAALGMAGLKPDDITMCQIYDCYTYTVVVTLEDYGFCAKGEGGPFASSGALGPGGALPVNTGGGQLSAYYMWGFTPLSEAIIQARGDGGDRQSPANDMILVSGNGGVLGHHGTLLLSPQQPTSQHTTQPQPATPPQPEIRAETDARAQSGPGPDALDGEARPATPALMLELSDAQGAGLIRSDERSESFFAAAGRDVLLIKRCERCLTWFAPSASGCPGCGDEGRLEWAGASGRARLVSWSVVHPRSAGPVAIPAIVELAEGPWLNTGLRLGSAAELHGLRAGQPLAADFVHPPEGESYPVFCPLGNPA